MAAAEAGSSLAGDAGERLEQASLGVARELRGELQRGQSDTSRALSQIQPRLQVCSTKKVGAASACALPGQQRNAGHAPACS